ncbi:hypothetical protein OPQ81_003707 [Rhizoctonia solani]|nr:hypothetical protein OPQ81_003707 [Rhizoctonia solani]
MSTRRRICAYALIIAISAHNLVAPETDARRLCDTLLRFGFPEDCVRILTGTQATRGAIIRYLRSIATNPNIKKNTPIFIYFAGHGIRQKITVPGPGAIIAECIIPYDTLATRDHVPPIPDITISALLGEIAKEKGNYITLLLDCCHSGSGSRGSKVEDNRGTLPEVLDFNPDDLIKEDGHMWSEFLNTEGEPDMRQNSRSVSTSYPGSFRYQGIKSHVLIASCRENEQSFEFSIAGQPPSGLFTAALLEALNDCRVAGMTWDVTYVGLFSRIKDFMLDLGQGKFPQTPQCEGYHRERQVFATPAFPHRHHAIAPITRIPPGPGHYRLPVGNLAGVVSGSEFEIYDYYKGEPHSKGCFTVYKLTGDATDIACGKDLKLGPDAYAVLCTLPRPLPIDLSPELYQMWNSEELQIDLRKRLNSRYPVNRFITLVRPGDASKLRVSHSRSTGGVKIEPTDGRGRPIVLRDLRVPRLSDTLAKAVMFYYHLERQVITSQQRNPFVFQALELMEPPISSDDPYLGALVEDPRQKAITFRPNEETHIYHSNAEWGLRIENHGTEAYYIYVFYFDPNYFSITPIYLPPTDDPSVLPRGLLTIGYRNTGASPLTFTIDRNLNTDPGFFKIFYSINPSEMSTIRQDGVDPDQLGDPRPGISYHQSSAPPFGSVLYPMAVLKPRSSGRR